MKFRTYQHLTLLLVIALSFSTLFTSCNKNGKHHRQKDVITVVHEFPSSNWTFEEQVLDLDFDIQDTVTDYRIEFILNYDSTSNQLKELPLNITLKYPDGMESFVSSRFNFDPMINKDITPTGQGSVCNMRLVAFPKKKLNQVGKYTIEFYRKAEKYDNYGLNSLTLKVIPIK